MPALTPEAIIEHLGLEPLDQEGGYFRQTWRSTTRLSSEIPGSTDPGVERTAGTAIYSLITRNQFSAMHRLKTDEVWLHHIGDPLEMLMLYPDGRSKLATIGSDLSHGQIPQHVCPANTWQGTRIAPGQDRVGYALSSCIVIPGFEWSDFELSDRNSLVSAYPGVTTQIAARTRPSPVDGKR